MGEKMTAWVNSYLELYRIHSDEYQEYLSGTSVFRIMQGNDGWRVILHGYLPTSLDLFINGGTIFEVCENRCGCCGVYIRSTCVMRFSECEIVRKWIRYNPQHLEAVQGYVEMSCEVWISPGGERC